MPWTTYSSIDQTCSQKIIKQLGGKNYTYSADQTPTAFSSVYVSKHVNMKPPYFSANLLQAYEVLHTEIR